MNWDDLRYFLALSRNARLQTAAQQLQVEHTTVARRIAQLEKTLGHTLFVRQPQGYVLTEAGRLLLPHAEHMESASLSIEQHVGASQQVSGVVRVGATESYGTLFLAQHLGQLTAQHRYLSIDLLAMPRLLNLSRREADIVISLERPPRGAFLMTKLTDYALHLYASADYLAKMPAIQQLEDLKQHDFVSYIDDLVMSPALNYLAEVCQPQRLTLRSTSLIAQQQAAIAGAGIAILPAFMAQQEPRLQPVLPQVVRLQRTFWMMMPNDLKDVARMRMTWDFIRRITEQHQALMHGHPAPSDGTAHL